MTRAFIRDLAALVLVTLGLGATIAAGGIDPRTLVFSVATIFAWGTTGTWGPALLALLTGIAAHPHDLQPFSPTPTIITAVLLGFGLGLLTRHLASQRWTGPLANDTTRALVALGLAVLFIVQPGEARLATADGQPLLFGLDVFDPTTLVTTHVERHVAVPLPHPLAALHSVFAALAIIAAWLGFARVGSERLRRGLFSATAIIAAVAAILAISLPLFDAPAIDPETIRLFLNHRAAGDGAILAVSLPEAHVAPWSRVPLDALRIVVAFGLLTLSLFQPSDFQVSRNPAGTNALQIALIGLVAAFGVGAMMPEVAAAAFAMLATALIAGRAGGSPLDTSGRLPLARAPHVVFLLALFALLAAIALAPLHA